MNGSNESKIRGAIQRIAENSVGGDAVLLCKVLAVDNEAFTCDCEPLNGDSPIYGAKLSGSDTDAGAVFIPAAGSTVAISFLSDSSGFEAAAIVVLYSDLDKIIFRGGSLGGLVKVEPLTARLNQLEEALQEIKQQYNSHTHPGNGVITSQLLTKTVDTTGRDEIENTNIIHG
jgi:hypothetical protein